MLSVLNQGMSLVQNGEASKLLDERAKTEKPGPRPFAISCEHSGESPMDKRELCVAAVPLFASVPPSKHFA